MRKSSKIIIPPTVLSRPRGFWDRALAVDADEVLVRFGARVNDHINRSRRSHGQAPLDVLRSKTYYFHADPSVGLSKEEEGEVIRQVALATQGGMGTLEFYDGAVDAMKTLRASCIQPFVLTNVPNALENSPAHEQRYGWGTAQAARTEQLRAAGAIRDSEDVIFCAAADKPRWMLERMYHLPLLVDDRPSTLISARWDYGLIAVGIRSAQTGYNQGAFEDVTWFDSFAAAVPAIQEVFAELERRDLLGSSPHIKEAGCHE